MTARDTSPQPAGFATVLVSNAMPCILCGTDAAPILVEVARERSVVVMVSICPTCSIKALNEGRTVNALLDRAHKAWEKGGAA